MNEILTMGNYWGETLKFSIFHLKTTIDSSKTLTF